MARFVVQGPFEVPVEVNKGGKVVTPAEARKFWKNVPELKSRKGCYVFGMRASKGLKPLYVGKATKSFGGEVFTHHKLFKYMQGMSHSKKGTPVLFFLCHPPGKGATNKSQIDELESFLIQAGLRANPNLVNERKTKQLLWSIAGVLRDGKGKPSTAAQSFKRLLGL